MIAWFVHGWGFGPAIWNELVPLLPRLEPRLADRGYFGGEGAAMPTEPALWIVHSFGVMVALAAMAGPCRALVAINGFDRFADAPGASGVASRLIDRMLLRLADDPASVVEEFRRRCGAGAVEGVLCPEALRRDLLTLRDGDYRGQAAALAVPVLSLQGGADPILSAEMRASTLHGNPGIAHRLHPEAGHLLPLEHPQWVARQIIGFVEKAC